MERKCMNCGTTIAFIDARGNPLWYRVRKDGEIIGYHCHKCYDKIRRAPLFQNFKEKLKQRLCSNCGKKTITTITKRGFPHQRWYNDGKGGFWCNHCYHQATYDSQREVTRVRNWRRLVFKKKTIYLKKNPRTGICSLCGKTGKRTHMHHLQYHDDNPLKDTIELCVSCHRKETIRLARNE